MLCPRCNTENKDTGIFCKKCGANIKEELQIHTLGNAIKEKLEFVENVRREILSEIREYEKQLGELNNSLQMHVGAADNIWDNKRKASMERLQIAKQNTQTEKQMQEKELQELENEVLRLEGEISIVNQKIQESRLQLELENQKRKM